MIFRVLSKKVKVTWMHNPLLSQLAGHAVCKFAGHGKKSMKLLQKKKHLTSAPAWTWLHTIYS